jgi:hypothetical protein
MKVDMGKISQDVNEKVINVTDHDLNDQQLFHIDKQHSSVLQTCLPTFKSQGISEGKEMVMDSLRNQMLINKVEKLPKFTGKTKQNVSK